MSAPIGNLGSVDYASETPPKKYTCGACGARGVKLWREYNTFLDRNSLRCGDCACREATANGKHAYAVELRSDGSGRVDIACTNPDGTRDRIFGGGDQISWRVPAVPTEEGDTYWGYTSVPRAGCEWWYRLPLREVNG